MCVCVCVCVYLRLLVCTHRCACDVHVLTGCSTRRRSEGYSKACSSWLIYLNTNSHITTLSNSVAVIFKTNEYFCKCSKEIQINSKRTICKSLPSLSIIDIGVSVLSPGVIPDSSVSAGMISTARNRSTISRVVSSKVSISTHFISSPGLKTMSFEF